jgi:8-oxo-dGTP pyrophosphatase MutT (NUDIX family)
MYRSLVSAGVVDYRHPSFWVYWARVQRRSIQPRASDSTSSYAASFGWEDRSPEFAHRDLHAEVDGWGPIRPGEERKHRYGIVIFNWRGEVLLREPANQFAGYVWQFAKGKSEDGEHPLVTARREVLEETGHRPGVVGFVPGGFTGGSGTINHYYLGEDHMGLVEPQTVADNGETSNLTWVSPTKALDLLGLSPNQQGRLREMRTLEAACAAYAELRPDRTISRLALPEAAVAGRSEERVAASPAPARAQARRRQPPGVPPPGFATTANCR